MPQKIVFLDRDGTISYDLGYTVETAGLKIIPGAGTGIAKLKRAGFLVVVVSNQSAIGRGLGTESQVRAVNREIERLLRLEDKDAHLDALLFCPHTPEAACNCRKPKTGMLEIAEFKWQVDREKSFMVGDKLIDLQFGKNAGLAAENCILVLSGEGEREKDLALAQFSTKTVVASDLLAACEHILARV